jgi:hypothetical protein
MLPESFLDAGDGTASGSSASGTSGGNSGSTAGTSSNGSSSATSSTSAGTGATSSSSSSSGGPPPCATCPGGSCAGAFTLIASSCEPCHNPCNSRGGLTTLNAPCQLLSDDISPLCSPPTSYIVPGQPGQSLIYQLVTCTEDCPCGFQQMPYQPSTPYSIGPLTAAQQQCIFDWILNLDGGLSECENL